MVLLYATPALFGNIVLIGAIDNLGGFSLGCRRLWLGFGSCYLRLGLCGLRCGSNLGCCGGNRFAGCGCNLNHLVLFEYIEALCGLGNGLREGVEREVYATIATQKQNSHAVNDELFATGELLFDGGDVVVGDFVCLAGAYIESVDNKTHKHAVTLAENLHKDNLSTLLTANECAHLGDNEPRFGGNVLCNDCADFSSHNPMLFYIYLLNNCQK